MEQQRLNPMSKLRKYGLFANIPPCYVIEEVTNLVIMPKISLKPPSTM